MTNEKITPLSEKIIPADNKKKNNGFFWERNVKEALKNFCEELNEILTPQLFHEIYEKYAVSSNWITNPVCRLKPFDELPETNQETMIRTLDKINRLINEAKLKHFGEGLI